jgi:hypothetical protein
MVTLYHRTSENIARHIVVDGFGDSQDYYGTGNLHSGVWLSDHPLDADEGANGDALLGVELNPGEREIVQFEWIEAGKPHREWLVPARLINELGTTVISETRELFLALVICACRAGRSARPMAASLMRQA